MKKYNHKKVEQKWQEKWKSQKLNELDMDKAKNPYYNLMMFPYPSAEGLHVGNMYAFTGSDIWGRYQRMKGFDVFEPIGLDGFGIHSENYAIKIGEHIRDVSQRTEKHFYKQLRMIGNQYDWSRTVETYKPEYYKWTQWLFIQMFKNGLAYRKKATVNWCSSCKTVLSDEQVESGVCERCKSETTTKDMEQWFWRITDYADRLDKNLDWIDWSEEVKVGQKNWIGKSKGLKEYWKVKGMDLKLETFTTWPHTSWGATFMVVAPEHPIIEKLVKGTKYEKGAIEFKEKVVSEKIKDPRNVEKVKEGYFMGRYVINHLNGREMPLYIANFAIYDYGTGVVKCTPAHDQRDYEFAKKYKLEIIPVISPNAKKMIEAKGMKEAYVGEGFMVNAEHFDGVDTKKARKEIGDYTIKKGNGEWTTNYKLRDWCISRQRYWGDPIPMVYCEKCGWHPVSEENLPVLLPEIEEFEEILPDGSGKGPLAKQDDFVNTTCEKCGGKARRETDVMDPFVDSSWYFLRYPSTEFDDTAFDKGRLKKWLPVNMYIGGKEHTVLHLLYSRFITMALKDWGFIDFEEPYDRFFGHGLLIKEGAKMSKSKGNVINPDEYISKYGADAVRMYLMFLGDFEQGGDWRDTGMKGMHKFINRVWVLFENRNKSKKQISETIDMRNIDRTIYGVQSDIERLSYNTAIAKIMEYINWYKSVQGKLSIHQVERFFSVLCLLIAPFAPHLSEEMWGKLGNKGSVHEQQWPKYSDKNIVSKEIRIAVQINGKIRDTIVVRKEMSKQEVLSIALKSKNVKKYAKKGRKKTIYVEGKILSIVV